MMTMQKNRPESKTWTLMMKTVTKTMMIGSMILAYTQIFGRNCKIRIRIYTEKCQISFNFVLREAERLQDGGQGTSQGTYSDSLLLIEGVETQGLFNWLLNSKLCLSSTGPLAGIPPTLFSPVAFHQATLRPLKVLKMWCILFLLLTAILLSYVRHDKVF